MGRPIAHNALKRQELSISHRFHARKNFIRPRIFTTSGATSFYRKISRPHRVSTTSRLC
jgi:hypothetical protein